MKQQMSPFQLIILMIFGLAGVGGVMFFALGGGLGGSSTNVGPVLIWGTLDERPFQTVVQALAEDDATLAQVQYEEHDARTFYTDLSEAIASGRGPDLIVMSSDFLVRHADKIMPYSYEAVQRRTFEESFVEQAQLYLTEVGVLGLPVAVDPLVLYWNRDVLAGAGFAKAPQYWDELFSIAERVTRRNEAGALTRSAVGFGEYENVTHAKDILATLIMQAGGDIVIRDEQGRLTPALTRNSDGQQPAQSALRFFTEFANPAKTVYTWNRSMRSSREAFAAGDVALYIGYASELPLIEAANPNLSVGISTLPQIRGLERPLTLGRMHAFAIPRGSLNPAGAQRVSFVLSQAPASSALSELRGTPSPHRDVLASAAASTSASTAAAVFHSSALIARGWYDPDPQATEAIFRGMIEGVTSGALRLGDAVNEADKALLELVR